MVEVGMEKKSKTTTPLKINIHPLFTVPSSSGKCQWQTGYETTIIYIYRYFFCSFILKLTMSKSKY